MALLLVFQGYYWPKMTKDCGKYAQECEKCQKFMPIHHVSSNELISIASPWPITKWGIDIVGSLLQAPRHKQFMLVATDYFSKWVKAETFANIKDFDVVIFLWKNILWRFRLLTVIVADNGSQFISTRFKELCSTCKIKI